MKNYMKRAIALLLVLAMQCALFGWGWATTQASADAPLTKAPEIPGLTFVEKTELTYAQCFSLFRYEGGYTLISVQDDGEFLVVPEDGQVPDGLDDSVVVLQQPMNRMYLAATSAMALFAAIDAVDSIRLTGTRASGWYVDAAIEALESGSMLFSGKYSEPDYELMIGEDCDLAIESTMIHHTPKVREMIQDLGIPVMIDCSSYEPHPLGRTEWVKLYAAIVGKEAEAEAFMEKQSALANFEDTGKTIAFFYINTDGSVVIRKPTDYIPKMLSLAGGHYVYEHLADDEKASSVSSVTMEDFYNTAVDADMLIYNAAIVAPISSIDELIAKDSLFADFKAVKEGNVWCTGKSYFQATDTVGEMIRDVHTALTGGDESQMTFLYRVF